jgi:hypothetical protein
MATWCRRIRISADFLASSRRDSRSQLNTCVIRRKTNRRHMIGDHHGRVPVPATLLLTALDGIFGTHRFRARRIDPYNEYLYTFFKCLAPDRLMYAEGWYARQEDDEPDIQLGDWIVQRRCPHLQGDLSRFGKTDGTTLTCTMHGWQFDLATGRCLASDAPRHRLRSWPAHSPAVAAR